MKNIWHKYPEQKPEKDAKIITFWYSIEDGRPMFNHEKADTYLSSYEYWCYESDLIAQIGDVK